MKFISVAALALVPLTVFGAAVEDLKCIDLTTCPKAGAEIAASKHAGQLFIRLNYAKSLSNKDLFGKQNPFVEFYLDSKYISRSRNTVGNNPQFNETFCFSVLPGQDTLYVKVVDKDTFSNDKIGEAKIPLANVFNTGSEGPKDYTLPKYFGLSSAGSLNMQMQFREILLR